MAAADAVFGTSSFIAKRDVSLARALLERFSRDRILKRHLPKDLGSVPILVSPDSILRLWRPSVDSDLFDFAREFVQPGNVVWDIGANVGVLSMAAAQRAGSSGQVVAVEADIWLAGLLSKSAAMQPATSARIQVLTAAAADSLGVARFNIAQRGRASNFLDHAGGSTQSGGIRETVSVITLTLDWLLVMGFAPPQVLKIDVEGAESSVLSGAERVLAEARPVILCEVYGPSSAFVTELLHRHGYTLFDWDAKPRVQTDYAFYNTLAIPPAL